SRLLKKGIFNASPLSLVSPKGGDVVGKKTVFTQGVEALEIETDNRPDFFNTPLWALLRVGRRVSSARNSAGETVRIQGRWAAAQRSRCPRTSRCSPTSCRWRRAA